MKPKLLFLSALVSVLTITVQAQLPLSRANLVFKNNSGRVIYANAESVEAYYNTTDNGLRIRVDLDRIVTQDSALDASFRALNVQWILFTGVVSEPARFFQPNNENSYPILNGVWHYSDKSIPVAATYTTQHFPNQMEEVSRTRLNFLSVFNPSSLYAPIVSTLADYELSFSLPDARVHVVTQW